MNRFFFSTGLALLLACQSAPEQAASSGPAAENTRTAVMQHHDALMARMDELVTERQRLQARLGQLDTLAAAQRPQVVQLRRLIDGLRTADGAMMTWMHQYQEPDTAQLTAHQYEDFWATEAEELRALDQQMTQALDSARAVR